MSAKLSILAEKWWPILAGIIATVLYGVYARTQMPPKSVVNLLSAVVSVAGIAVGFLAAAGAIIISIDSSKVIQDLKETGYYRLFIKYLNAAAGWSFALATVSAIGLLRDFETTHWPWQLIAVWVFVLSTSTACYFRVMRSFAKILNDND